MADDHAGRFEADSGGGMWEPTYLLEPAPVPTEEDLERGREWARRNPEMARRLGDTLEALRSSTQFYLRHGRFPGPADMN